MRPLEDGLEKMLETGELPAADTPAGAYLKAHPDARKEVMEMMEISRLLRENFKAPDEIEPAPGFYARVMARIEAEALPPSIWNFFLEPFGHRLVYASLACAVLLFAALLAAPEGVGEDLVASQPVTTVMEITPLQGVFLASDAPGFGWVEHSPEDDRGAALLELVTYEQ